MLSISDERRINDPAFVSRYRQPSLGCGLASVSSVAPCRVTDYRTCTIPLQFAQKNSPVGEAADLGPTGLGLLQQS